MDATELLAADHQKVRSLFEQIQTVENYAEKRRIFDLIKLELDAHSTIEETIFYPLFAGREDFRAMIEEAYDEHQEVKDLLEEIASVLITTGDQEQFAEQVEDKIDELIENVEHHVEEEEGNLFPKVRDVMNAEELEQVGVELEAARNEQLASAA